MDYLAYSHMAVANEEGTGSTELNLRDISYTHRSTDRV